MCKDKDSFLYKNVLFYKSFGILRIGVMSERAGWVDTLPLSGILVVADVVSLQKEKLLTD